MIEAQDKRELKPDGEKGKKGRREDDEKEEKKTTKNLVMMSTTRDARKCERGDDF